MLQVEHHFCIKGNKRGHGGFLRIAEWCVIAPLDLLQFISVAQSKQRLLDQTHFLHFAHHILVDAIHDFLLRRNR